MQFKITAGGMSLGETRLETHEASKNKATGAFTPSAAFGKYSYLFQLLSRSEKESNPTASAELLNDYVRNRDAIHLKLETSTGEAIPTQVINIRISPKFVVEVVFQSPAGLGRLIALGK